MPGIAFLKDDIKSRNPFGVSSVLGMGVANWTIGAASALQSGIAGEVPRRLGWNVPPEELIHIPEHWFSYTEPPASIHLLLALFYLAYLIIGVFGNWLVIWIFSSAKSLRSASNMLVVNLAVCDLVMTIKTPVFLYNSFHGGFALGHLGCQIFGFLGALSGIGQGMTNAFIAYDRYNTITRPLDGKMSRTKAFVMILIVWMYAAPWAVFPLTETWGRFVPEGFLTSCTFDYLTDTYDTRVFVASIFACSYCVPMLFIIFYYSRIVSTVFDHEKALRRQAKKMNVDSLRSNQAQQSAEVRITKAAITMCFLFVLSWTPYAVLALIGAFGDQRLLTPGVTMIPACTCKLVACIDPYIYAISHPRYRAELEKKVPWLGIKEPVETASSGTAATQENVKHQNSVE